jgi:hypothetical protein
MSLSYKRFIKLLSFCFYDNVIHTVDKQIRAVPKVFFDI